jgi:hypothetical protein
MAAGNPLAELALRASREPSALQQGTAGRALLAAIESADAEVLEQALAKPASPNAAQALERGLDLAMAGNADAAISLQALAFPILLVAGGKAPATIPGAVPDVGALRELLEVHGALGQNRNFGLGNALVGETMLAAIRPRDIGMAGDAPRIGASLAPEPVALDMAAESASLRFLVGAALTPRDAPGVPETAANVGAWGMPWTRALSEQLAQPELSLLAIPRPPQSLRRALATGRFARAEIAFQLFLSQALREVRAKAGEPWVRVSSHADGTVRVALATPFDEGLAPEHRWAVGPADDYPAIATSVLALLAECRLDDVEVVPTLQPVGGSH